MGFFVLKNIWGINLIGFRSQISHVKNVSFIQKRDFSKIYTPGITTVTPTLSALAMYICVCSVTSVTRAMTVHLTFPLSVAYSILLPRTARLRILYQDTDVKWAMRASYSAVLWDMYASDIRLVRRYGEAPFVYRKFADYVVAH